VIGFFHGTAAFSVTILNNYLALRQKASTCITAITMEFHCVNLLHPRDKIPPINDALTQSVRRPPRWPFFALLGRPLFSIRCRHRTETMRWRYVILSFFICLYLFFFPLLIYTADDAHVPCLAMECSPTERLQSLPTTLNIMMASNQQGCNSLVY